MEKKFVYADNAATTRISQSVLDAMMPYLTDQFGNPSGVYSIGRRARRAVETARQKAAQALGCEPSEICFTSGGTESDNWALAGTYRALAPEGKKRIISTVIEHPAVLNTLEYLKKQGADIVLLPVAENGRIDPEEVRKAITPDTALVSVMAANNETGVIQPVDEISRICEEHEVLFHTDAVQAVPHLRFDLAHSGISLLSLSGHKLHAPKGTGILYIKNGLSVSQILFGGSQESGLRPGTENTAAIAGLGKALEDLFPDHEDRNARISALRDKLADGLLKNEGVIMNGDRENMLPGHCSISVKGADGEKLLLMLDLKGICASAGSACTSGDAEPSHVLKAMGVKNDYINGSVRFTLDEYNTEEDVDYITETFAEILKKAL
ncbi:cysteine desulfurase family protein [Ruminococcus sp. HUN007]|uniref:cysteine desulfurase family protein n=1 Tax=Ruminococcus sp. HUN007 TaxID=1514668 RepID=UPI0005D1577B|nr:cysteine desulfurase family protein [Ruminococcus sp. HUN007]